MMKPDEMIAVIQAFKKGKAIQCASLRGSGTDLWIDAEPSWQFDSMKYRVKPEPQDFWIMTNSSGTILYTYSNLAVAQSRATDLCCTLTHVREVL